MDIHNIGEFHCDVCFELFGENQKCPRMLVCGHSFCHSCLNNLLVQSPSCPNCKIGIQFPNVDCIPVNYSIKSVVSRFNVTAPVNLNEQNTVLNPGPIRDPKEEVMDSLTLKEKSSSKELPYEGSCEDHSIYKHLRCMDCKCWVCGVCATINHKPCRTLLVTEAWKEMQQEVSKEVRAEIEAQKSINKTLDKSLKDLEGKRMSLNKDIENHQTEIKRKRKILKLFDKNIKKLQLLKSERKKHCNEVKAIEASVISCETDGQFTKATSKLKDFLDQSRKLMEELTIPRHWNGHLTIEVLKSWCQEESVSVYASRCQNGMNQYGQVKVVGNRVWVYCFQQQIPQMNNVVVSFRELLVSFNGSSEHPRRGFIQVEDETSGLTDVVIATDALTPRAMNFLLLCSGIEGRSYEGVKLEADGKWIITPPNGGGAIVKGIKDNGVYEAPVKKGFVGGWFAAETDSLSRFGIRMIDEKPTKLIGKFGFVEEGLDFCERIHKNQFKGLLIEHCGLVI